MNTKPYTRSARTERNRATSKPVNFDGALPHRQSDHTKHVTVEQLKAERLRVRNERRIANGLPPIS
jgi:hypothetical protein